MNFNIEIVKRWLIGALVLFSSVAFSQSVSILDLSPKSGTIRANHLTMVMLVNSTNEDITGSLKMQLTNTQGELISELQSRQFKLVAGGSISTTEIPWLSRFAYGQNEEGAAFSRLGLLPFGDYSVCYDLTSDDGVVRGLSCTEKRSQPVLRFSLLYPGNKSVINNPFPMLSWEDMATLVAGRRSLSYKLLLVEVFDEQSGGEALEENIPLVQKDGITTNSMLYPIGARSLENDRRYAWMVTAYQRGEELIHSQVWEFTLKSKEVNVVKPKAVSSFAVLDTRLNNRYHLFGKSINIAFDNNEGMKELLYRIVNVTNGHKSIKNLPKVKGLVSGLNTISIPTEGVDLNEGEKYYLEIQTQRGQSYFLQFAIKS